MSDIVTLSLSRDGSTLALFQRNEAIHVCFLATDPVKRRTWLIKPGYADVGSGETHLNSYLLSLSDNGMVLVGRGNHNRQCCVFWLDEERQVMRSQVHSEVVNRCLVSSDGKLLVVESDSETWIWNLEVNNGVKMKEKLDIPLDLTPYIVHGPNTENNGRNIEAGYNMRAKTIIGNNGRNLVTRSKDGVLLWEINASGQAQLSRVFKNCADFALSREAAVLAIQYRSYTEFSIEIWDLDNIASSTHAPRMLTRIPDEIMSFLSDDGRLLSTSTKGTGKVFRVLKDGTVQQDGTVQHLQSFGSSHPLGVSSDGMTAIRIDEKQGLPSEVSVFKRSDLAERPIKKHLLGLEYVRDIGVTQKACSVDRHGIKCAVAFDNDVRVWELQDSNNDACSVTVAPSDFHNYFGRIYCVSDDLSTIVTRGVPENLDGSPVWIDVWRRQKQFYVLSNRLSAGGELTRIFLSRDGRILASVGANAAQFWQLSDLQPQETCLMLQSLDRIDCATLSSDGKLLFTGSKNKIFRWDLTVADASKRPIEYFDCGHVIIDIKLAFNDNTLIVRTVSHLLVLNLRTLSPSPKIIHDGAYDQLTLSVDNAMIALRNKHAIYLIDAHDSIKEPIVIYTNFIIPAHQDPGLYSMALSGNGRILVFGHVFTNEVQLWDVSTSQPEKILEDLPGHEVGVSCIKLNYTGTTIITGDQDGIVRIWNLEGGNRVTPIVLRGHTSLVRDLELSIDETRVMSLEHGGVFRIWSEDVRDLIESARHSVGRNLSMSEWQQYFGDELYRRTCPDLPDGVGVNQPRGSTP